MSELTGRTALVTGAGSGIGYACALRLAQDGAHVIAVDIDSDAADAVARATGGEAITADLSQASACDSLGETNPDIVVNNAGLQHVAPLHEFPPETFEHLMRIMVTAPFRITRAVLPGMYQRGHGRFIHVSSVHGQRASAYKSAYVTAKHALEGLSKVIAIEGAAHGVTSSCVAPAYVRTPLVEQQIDDQAASHGIDRDAVIENIMLEHPAIKRLIEPREVAAAVSYLSGPDAAMITGTCLTIDGGWTAR